ncbi:CAP domain-containing protein [Ligilactobacillus hohenheimensis]|uniref:CAP domain-containing protein n=1 Tax=Ligilactobacillus hohenheimensis TaxID=2991832 RepID=UPI0024B9654F|nr:CAP domain-containing protein [Ligilactobacillus hohenheimensis]
MKKKKQLLTAAAVGAATVAAGMGAANVHADSVTVTKQHIGDETKVTTTTHHDGKSQSQISSDKAAVASQKKVVSSAKASMDSAQSVVNNDKTKVSSAQANVNSAKSKLDSAQSKVNEPSSLKNDMSKQSQRISSDKTAIANKQNDVKNDQTKVAQDQQHKLTPEQQSKIAADKQAVTDAQNKVNQDEQNVKKAETQNPVSLTDKEQAALNEINKWRTQNGLAPLKVADNLQKYAEQRAKDGAKENPDWQGQNNQIHAMGYPEKNGVAGDVSVGSIFGGGNGTDMADIWYNDPKGINIDWPAKPHHNMMMNPAYGSIGIAEYDGGWVAVYAVGNPVGLSNADNSALTAAQNQLKNDQQALQNAQNQLNNDEQTFGVKQLENDQKQLQQDQQDLNNLQNDLQNAQNQLDNDQKTLNSITPADIANAKKALADAQNDYNNAVQALNQAQAQENADQATLAKYQTAYQSALQKLDELEAALKADEPYNTTSVQWIKDQQPMTSAEISSHYVMRSTAKASYKSGDADVVYADTVTANKQATKKALPDTGDAQNSAASMAGILGLGLAGILSMFGLAERKKRN